MAALMNALREEVAVATTSALSTAPATTQTTITQSVLSVVRQEATTTVTKEVTTTTTNSLLKDVGLNNGSSLLPKHVQQLESINSPRELVSQAMQQGLEGLGDSLLDQSKLPTV